MSEPVPAGMVAVSQKEFFSQLYADKRDIMPSLEHPTYTLWKSVHPQDIFGWSFPGWKYPGQPKQYAVRVR